ncbi:hypothetical protein SS50377_26044 [Spironucleus salmonicida]|uniref:Uncharacterized protein n=1 Tax=Spironucleus salmonicida TaxID=348837 RepID=A0A9P8LPB6_9EUKA|nr:hypothetical protein SS50377_26044 [Spironucleus salmonicida]
MERAPGLPVGAARRERGGAQRGAVLRGRPAGPHGGRGGLRERAACVSAQVRGSTGSGEQQSGEHGPLPARGCGGEEYRKDRRSRHAGRLCHLPHRGSADRRVRR